MTRTTRAALLMAAVLLAALDLWSKSLWEYPAMGRPTKIEKIFIENWLVSEPVYNPGGVWSLSIPSGVLLVATLLAIPLILAWILVPKRTTGWELAGKLMVLSGAIGNGYDRIEFGKVRDFINVYFGDYNGWNWPTFNIADAALVGGIGVLLVLSFLHKHPKEAKAA